jgi:predicted phosphodiesterase
MSAPSEKGNLVKEYLDKYPTMLTNTLARFIYEQNKELYKDKEEVRSFIRYYRHAQGAPNRKKVSTDKYKRLNGDDYRRWAGFETQEEAFEDYPIPLAHKKMLLLSDIHVPYHDQEAVITALEYGKQEKVDSVLLNGDIIDFYHLSKFCKDPRRRNLQFELDMLYELFCIIHSILGEVKIFYKEGNHEYRLETYLKIKAPELLGIEEFELSRLASFDEFGITWINKKRIITFGKLNILHGHELYGFSAAVNPARGLYLKSKKSAIAGHLHQTSEHAEPDLHGKPVACWSVGCLCYLHPEYAPINKWNHGFAIISRDNGTFSVNNKRIYNGKIL